MAVIPYPSLFSWTDVDCASDLDRLRMVLEVIPDEDLMLAMEAARGNGRDDYPIRAVWNSVLSGVVFGHTHIESLRRELRRNAELRDVCGFDVLKGMEAVPTSWAYSRFLRQLFNYQAIIDAMFDGLVDRLVVLLPDFGKSLGVDSKGIESFGNPTKQPDGDGRRDTDAQWGKKEYHGENADGKSWKKIVTWFGYKLHLLVDTTYELPVAYEVTGAAASDMTNLLPLVEKTRDRHPDLIERCEELSADKGYDSNDNNIKLYAEHDIKPIIDIRNMWKDSDGADGTRSLYPDRADNIVYDYRGNVFCMCPVTGEKRDMAFCGFEKDRESLKYRCPAAHFDLDCKGRGVCGGSGSEYGRIVRIPLEMDRRIFTPVPRSSQAWKIKYAKRTAVERVNSRLDVSFGFEVHTIRGVAKMKLRSVLALVVMLAMAVGAIRSKQAYKMRSLVWSVKEPKRKAA
jgi:hypothetical protein